MYTLIDYLNYYKNRTISDVSWNTMDNLLCSILVYLPIKSFNDSKYLNAFFEYSKKHFIENNSAMAPVSLEVLEIIYDSKRYSNLKISSFINMKDDDIQFGAATFRISDKTIISYKGTDGSLIGWIENFRVGYLYPTKTHKLAIDYLNKNISFFGDNNTYIVGHSKGGNLAMVSAMETNSNIFKKIKNIYNFDGPGLRKDEFESEKYSKISGKLINIIPTGSVVGVILNNMNYHVVKSNNFALNEHYPTSWNTYGEFFVEGKLSKVSEQLHENTTNGFNDLDQVKVKETFETLFASIEKQISKDNNISIDDIINIIKNIKKMDPKVSKYFEAILNSMIKLTSKNKKNSDE